MSTFRNTDRVWSAGQVRILLDGTTTRVARDATGREYEVISEGPTADDLREQALAGGPLELVLDAVQLERAIDAIEDDGVRSAMKLRLAHHPHELPDYEIGDRLWSEMGEDREGHQLIARGIQLVVQHERGRLHEARPDGVGQRPVCWRCMKRRVKKAGKDCGAGCPKLKGRTPKWKRDPLKDWDVEKLIATQASGEVPGSEYTDDREVPLGTYDDFVDVSLAATECGRQVPVRQGCE